jgi:thiamine biosynthesis lipoprotein
MLETELVTRSMGGELRLRVASAVEDGARAERDLRLVAERVEAWARRLTRFSEDSDLSALNADPAASIVCLRPTLGAVMSHAQSMKARTEGTVDITMLDQRIAAESDGWVDPSRHSTWSHRLLGGLHVLTRNGRVRFDLDGVAKGWIADRALRLLDAYPSACVDADGDVAMRAAADSGWQVALEDPRKVGADLASVRVPRGWTSGRYGVATSGTSVHRWVGPAGATHHLIDPLTGRPAVTDVLQATVIAEDAATAECLAKAAVIRGSSGGLELMRRAGAWAALLVLEDGETVTTPGTSRWLV